MIRAGLASITFRDLTAEEIIEASVKAGIEGVEWGGDVHVLPGNIKRAEEVGRLTRESGLEVVSYGSYFRLGGDGGPFEAILHTAKALEAPVIRVWAGRSGSGESTPEQFDRIVKEAREAGELCREAGIKLAFEFHANTLTDTNGSALKLMRTIGHPAVSSYWQPPVGMLKEECLKGIGMIQDYLQWIHVFHWEPDFQNRRKLSRGASLWREYFQGISTIEKDRWALLEFVENNSLESFYEDVETLKALLSDCR